MHSVHHADIFEWAKNYKGEPFDGILCDPPYELGFMGKSWDSTGIAFNQEMWKAVYDIMKPGAHLLAFSGSRTYHRMVVAIEDAGFEIRDMIEWVYGSGFPKSLNIGKAVDKMEGNERDYVGPNKYAGRGEMETAGKVAYKGGPMVRNDITKGTSEWEGYGTALKPAHEPIVLARKPIEGTVAQNVLKHGTGGLNTDDTRVGSETRVNSGGRTGKNPYQSEDTNLNGLANTPTEVTGRFPANLIHDGSDEVEAVFPNESSRFFYTAKASKSERNAGLEGFEGKPAYKFDGGPKINQWTGQLETNQKMQNHHPTVKPLSLTKYLATLIKPPAGGRLLVPFAGSGSEMIGALQAGWNEVVGVELTEEYIPIAEARIKYWTRQEVLL